MSGCIKGNIFNRGASLENLLKDNFVSCLFQTKPTLQTSILPFQFVTKQYR